MIAAPVQTLAPGSTCQISASNATPQSRAVYSSGASTEASPRTKASVIVNWPAAPTTPTPPTISQCCGVSGVQSGAASAPAPSAMNVMSQNTIDGVLSVRVSTRTVMAEIA